MRVKTIFKFALPLLVLGGAVVVAGVLQATKPELVPTAPAERSWLVSTTIAKVETVQPDVIAYGEIVAVRDIELRAAVAGPVIEASPAFLDGAKVKAGNVLVRIDPFEFEIALGEASAALAEAEARLIELSAQIAAEEASLKQNNSQIALTERELKRREKLKEGGVGTDKSIDDVRMQMSEREEARTQRRENLKAWRARADQSRAQITRLELAKKRAQRDLDDATIRAPFDGYLTETAASLGKRLGPNDRIGRLIDVSSLEAKFHVSDAVYGRLINGKGTLDDKKVAVRWRSGDSVREFDATLARIGSRTAASSGGIELYARLNAFDGETPLRPGAFVEIELADRMFEQAALLPDTALHDDKMIYVVTDGRLEVRQVQLLARAGNDVIVQGKVKTGDVVVTSRFAEIGPGAKVTQR
ncbi:MAG: efflux RND transporter periplasmic adaptor subunit [Alphaproteobacteria bacterium]|nr:efflux RND transporter periplasmic adaptor subunit [Alphaproteobacteria bacterium]